VMTGSAPVQGSGGRNVGRGTHEWRPSRERNQVVSSWGAFQSVGRVGRDGWLGITPGAEALRAGGRWAAGAGREGEEMVDGAAKGVSRWDEHGSSQRADSAWTDGTYDYSRATASGGARVRGVGRGGTRLGRTLVTNQGATDRLWAHWTGRSAGWQQCGRRRHSLVEAALVQRSSQLKKPISDFLREPRKDESTIMASKTSMACKTSWNDVDYIIAGLDSLSQGFTSVHRSSNSSIPSKSTLFDPLHQYFRHCPQCIIRLRGEMPGSSRYRFGPNNRRFAAPSLTFPSSQRKADQLSSRRRSEYKSRLQGYAKSLLDKREEQDCKKKQRNGDNEE
jgi:hypothetical protein